MLSKIKSIASLSERLAEEANKQKLSRDAETENDDDEEEESSASSASSCATFKRLARDAADMRANVGATRDQDGGQQADKEEEQQQQHATEQEAKLAKEDDGEATEVEAEVIAPEEETENDDEENLRGRREESQHEEGVEEEEEEAEGEREEQDGAGGEQTAAQEDGRRQAKRMVELASIENDTNNNQPRKRSRNELIDIVEVSRERRLSKESADSLANFIKWSFSNFDRHHNQKQQAPNDQEELLRAVSRLARKQNQHDVYANDDQMLGGRQKAQPALGSGAATNQQHKRARVMQNYTVDTKLLGQQQRVLGTRQPNSQTSPFNSNSESGASSNLSFHLQQFLQQQQQHQSIMSPENLCTTTTGTVGAGPPSQQTGAGDDSNQLALAAAIHRALVDSVANNSAQQQQARAAVAQNESGRGASSSSPSFSPSSHVSSAVSSPSSSSGAVNLVSSNTTSGQPLDSLVGTTGRYQRLAYNTRAALNGLMPASNSSQQNQGTNRHQNATVAAMAALNMSNRHVQQQQQQRQTQAAAAFLALANANATSHSPAPGAANANASGLMGVAKQSLGGTPIGAGPLAPMVDFECDTCGSSFDDRHRLMQHQSIHLELKKDWFTETPVDEVMKIFNRRRGEFLCNICNLRFEATLDFDQHNHSVHGPRPYCCQFCGNGTRTFKCWRQYLNHLYDHRYIFACTIDNCDFTVNRRDSLRFHIFRFHLNCQLPHNQIIKNHHQYNSKNNNNWQQQQQQHNHHNHQHHHSIGHHQPHHETALNGTNPAALLSGLSADLNGAQLLQSLTAAAAAAANLSSGSSFVANSPQQQAASRALELIKSKWANAHRQMPPTDQRYPDDQDDEPFDDEEDEHEDERRRRRRRNEQLLNLEEDDTSRASHEMNIVD